MNPMLLTRLESDLMRLLLAGDHPVLAQLRHQLETARVVNRELSGVGFFTTFAVDAPPVANAPKKFWLGDVHGAMAKVRHGAGFVLFVDEGRLNMLEGFTYDDPWPESCEDVELRYAQPHRAEELAKLAWGLGRRLRS